MRNLIFILLMFFSINLYAYETSKYIIEKEDGSLAILSYVEGSNRSLNESLRLSGYEGRPFHNVTNEVLPEDSADFWEWKNGRVQVNQQKKSQAELVKQEKESRRQSHFQRLQLSEEEFKELVNA